MEKKDAFQRYSLEYVDSEPTGGCGNPFNLMTKEEYEMIINEKPKSHLVTCRLNSILYNKIIKEEDLIETISSDICADCWGIFTITNDRKEVVKIYYDNRNSDEKKWRLNLSTKEYHEKVKELGKERERLCNDPSDLIDDIKQNNTVVIVLGCEEFIEMYYYKIGEMYFCSTIDHTMTWK